MGRLVWLCSSFVSGGLLVAALMATGLSHGVGGHLVAPARNDVTWLAALQRAALAAEGDASVLEGAAPAPLVQQEAADARVDEVTREPAPLARSVPQNRPSEPAAPRENPPPASTPEPTPGARPPTDEPGGTSAAAPGEEGVKRVDVPTPTPAVQPVVEREPLLSPAEPTPERTPTSGTSGNDDKGKAKANQERADKPKDPKPKIGNGPTKVTSAAIKKALKGKD